MKLLIYLFIVSFSFSQNVETVIALVGKPENKLIQFELEFLKKIIHIHNKKSKDQLKLKVQNYPTYQDIYERIDSLGGKTDFVVGVCASTIFIDKRYNEKFHFSEPFLPVKSALIGRTDVNFDKDQRFTISIVERVPAYEQMFNVLKEVGYKYKKNYVISYDKLSEETLAGKSHAYVGDTIDAWLNDKLKIVYEIEKKNSYFGFLYQNSSVLKEKLNPTIQYLKKSPIYYKLLKKYFGADFKSYYEKMMFI